MLKEKEKEKEKNALILIDSGEDRVYMLINDETYLDDIEFEAFNGRIIEVGIDPKIKLADAIKLYA